MNADGSFPNVAGRDTSIDDLVANEEWDMDSVAGVYDRLDALENVSQEVTELLAQHRATMAFEKDVQVRLRQRGVSAKIALKCGSPNPWPEAKLQVASL